MIDLERLVCEKCKEQIIYSKITGTRGTLESQEHSALLPIWCLPCVKAQTAKLQTQQAQEAEGKITITKQEYQTLLIDRSKFYALKSAALLRKET